VYVTGAIYRAGSDFDSATVAYNAATGAQLWAVRYDGAANEDNRASAVAVSPSGATVYVTGSSQGATSGYDYVTLAYDAATGARQWDARYNGPANGDDIAAGLAVSPTTGAVFVTGESDTTYPHADIATVAYHG
jgi:DNA-binding beta-propeller fold protein YncE